MASLGEKIKEVFTGHSSSHESGSDVRTPDVDAPGAYPTDKHTTKDTELHNKLHKAAPEHMPQPRDSAVASGRAEHHDQLKHHDPEVDAKAATSAAGNYPYWGDLPREDETSHGHNLGESTAPRHGHEEQPYNVHKSSGVPSGVNSEIGTATSSGLTSRDNYHQGQSGVSQTELPDRTRTTNYPPTSAATNTAAQQHHDGSHKGEIAAATGAGALGAGYLASRHHDDQHDKKHHHQQREPELAQQKPTPGGTALPISSNQAGSDSRIGHRNVAEPPRQTSQMTGTTSTGPGSSSSYLTNDAAAGSSSAAPGQHQHDHRARHAAYVGAGAAGLGAASHMALKQHDAQFLPEDRHSNSAAAAYGSTGAGRDSSSTAGHTPGLTGTSHGSTGHTHGGIHNTVIGAGSPEHPETHHSSSTSSGAPLVPPHRTSDIYGHQQHSTAGNDGGIRSHTHEHRDRDGLVGAAGLGAGAGALAAEEKHRHHKTHDDKPGHQHQHHQHHHDALQPGQTPSSQQPAHAAATQAWNKHDNQPSTSPATTGAHDHSRHAAAPAAVGAGAAAAGAGAVAAYYGQGREHEQNPRSEQSERIAARALGEESGAGAAHGVSSSSQRHGSAPSAGGYDHSSSTSGLGSQGVQNRSLGAGSAPPSSAAPSSATGFSGSGLTQRAPGSKVLHRCHQCGADNDISDYFKKDAVFKVGS